MTADKPYYSPATKTRTRFTVQGSRFIATLAPADDEKIVLDIIKQVSAEFTDATHHTYAYRIGSGRAMLERSSDDREPAGTAGAPMLQVLQGNNVSDALVIGTRYYGGTKLGIGGLTRAYRDCARQALADANLKKKEILIKYSLQMAYEDLGSVTRLIETLQGIIIGTDYSDTVSVIVQIPACQSEALQQGFDSACRGRGSLQKP